MLPISRISDIEPYTKGWFKGRLGKITSSPVSCLCAPKGIGDGGYTYIRNKVHEEITGQPSDRNIETEGTLWGITYEPMAIDYWRKNTPSCIKHLPHQHIVFGERFASTPDDLVFMNEKLLFGTDPVTGEETLNCETLEAKCYMTPSVHMAHVECQTPAELKALNPKVYWQTISQIEWANVTRGRAVFFHPHYKDGHPYKMGEVIFKKTELIEEFKFFNTRMAEAEKLFDKFLNYRKPVK